MSPSYHPSKGSSRRGRLRNDSSRSLGMFDIGGDISASAVAEDLGTCVQEWTGTEWLVVDDSDCPPGSECRVLDPCQVAGEYVGQRVITRASKVTE